MSTTRLSTKGQLVLPKDIRATRAWGPGTEFTVEETQDGILLRPSGRFPATRLEDGAGCLGYKGKAKTLAEMDAAIRREVAPMTAVDTNVLVRLLKGDHPRQAVALCRRANLARQNRIPGNQLGVAEPLRI